MIPWEMRTKIGRPGTFGSHRGKTRQAGIREGYLDWYAGHRPLLYMLSVLATMLSKRCVMNPKKHIPPISFVPFKNASPKDAPYALLPMRMRGGYKTAKTQARSFYVRPWLLPIIIG